MGSLFYAGSSGTSGVSGFSGTTGVGTVIRSLSNFRLTLESGVAVSTTNQSNKTTLYFTPYTGNCIALYYNSTWSNYTTSEVSYSLSGKTDNTIFDVFAYYTGSAVALELVAWSSSTARATALTRQNGVYVKSGDATRKYVGSIRTGPTGQSFDRYTDRYLWNYFNRVRRGGFSTNTNSSWTYSTATWHEHNAGSGQIRFSFILGMPQIVEADLGGITTSGTGTAGYNGYCIDGTTTAQEYYYVAGANSNIYYGCNLQNTNTNMLAIGFHYITGTEYASGTITNYGGGSISEPNYASRYFLYG